MTEINSELFSITGILEPATQVTEIIKAKQLSETAR